MEKTTVSKVLIYHARDLLPEEIIRFIKKNNLQAEYEILQTTVINDVANKIICIYSNGIPVGLSFYQIVHVKASHLKLLTHLPFLKREMLTASIQIANPKLIVYGNLYRPVPAFTIEPSVNGNTGYIIKKLIEATIQKEKPFILILKDMPADLDIAVNQLDFDRFADVSMIMNIHKHWEKMEDYTDSMRSKYRKAYLITNKKFEPILKKDLTLQDMRHYSSDIERLYLNVANQGDVSLGFLTGDYFASVKKAYRDTFRVTGFFFGDKLIGFSSYFLSEHEMTTNYIGMDYAFNEQFNIYFNILYEYIRQAILLQNRSLNLGRTSFDAKARMGAKPVSTYSYYKIINPMLRPVCDAIINKYKQNPEEKWRRYRPLREHE